MCAHQLGKFGETFVDMLTMELYDCMSKFFWSNWMFVGSIAVVQLKVTQAFVLPKESLQFSDSMQNLIWKAKKVLKLALNIY